MNTEWKPIASAPKDGSEFLACYGRQGNVLQLVKWNKIHGYFESKGKPELGFTSNATDWMPVSAPTSHPIPTGATGEDERKAFETWAVGFGYQRDELARCKIGIVSPEYFDLNTENVWKAWQARAHIDAPAGGDALAVEDQQHLNWMIAEECRIETLTLGNNTRYRVHWPDVDEHQAEWFFSPGGAIRAAIAQQSQRKEA